MSASKRTAEAIAAKVQSLSVEDRLTVAAACARRGDLSMARAIADTAIKAIDAHQTFHQPLPGASGQAGN